MPGQIITIVLVAIVILIGLMIVAKTIRIVPQSNCYVVERLGAYNRSCNVGIHILIPFFDRVANRVSLKEQVVDFEPQPVITKDNVTMQIDTVVYFQITDPKLFTYGVVRPINAIENLTATTLRNIIGDLELDETLTSRDLINAKMRSILDEATDPWGIKVHRVEVKNIIPPRDIQEAMEKQMRAERERREAILQAEGKKTAAILTAEGEKESTILRAEADKEAKITRATGEAEALRLVFEAQAKGIAYINEASPQPAYVQLQGYKALEKLSEGEATKIIIPSEIQGLAGLVSSVKEIATDPKKEK
ncbi:MAG: SPFH domain-containing protein [Beduini sp.]|uniref:SPFH domain-containing protein n=1 Tax=Beduini sp. TaxID=1922300 RepID=UPI0039A0BAFE